MPKTQTGKTQTSESLEQKLWKAADKLRKNIDAAEYKHIVLGLIFLKYISDAFDELHEKLAAGEGEYEGADPEDPDEYKAENVFFVPAEARWSALQAQAKQPTIGQKVDEAMEAIEFNNPKMLKGILPKVYGQQKLDPASLGGLIDQKIAGTYHEWKRKPSPPAPLPAGEGSRISEASRPVGERESQDAASVPFSSSSQREEDKVPRPLGEGSRERAGYQDIKGFCKSATLADIEKHNFVLTPGRYVGIPDEEDDGVPFAEKMGALTAELAAQMQEAEALDKEIKIQLAKVGFDLEGLN